MSSGMRIEVLNREGITDGSIYCAIGIGGGLLNKDFLVGDENFVSSYAFANLILNYIRTYYSDLEINAELLRSCEVISFTSRSAELFNSTLKKILGLLLAGEFQREVFDRAKTQCLNTFEANYKNAKFRALIKAYEFSDLHKKFLMTSYLDDLKDIDFSKFVSCAKKLILPSNICIYVLCNDVETITQQIKSTCDYKIKTDVIVSALSHEFDPFLRQDAHISNLARENATVIIEAFEFLNKSATPFAKYLVLDVLASALGESSVMVYADNSDASITVETEKVCSYKQAINRGLDKDNFERAKSRLLNNYVLHLKKEPLDFSIRAVELAFSGVFIDQYLSFLSQCTFEQFEEIIKNCNYIVSEAQIALRKESRNV